MTQRSFIRFLVGAIVLSAVASAWTQSSGSPGASQAWLDMNLDKAKRIKLEFSNANVELLLRLMAKCSGVPIMKDPALSRTVSISTDKAVSLSDAFAMLSAVLDLRGFEFQGRGGIAGLPAVAPRGSLTSSRMSGAVGDSPLSSRAAFDGGTA